MLSYRAMLHGGLFLALVPVLFRSLVSDEAVPTIVEPMMHTFDGGKSSFIADSKYSLRGYQYDVQSPRRRLSSAASLGGDATEPPNRLIWLRCFEIILFALVIIMQCSSWIKRWQEMHEEQNSRDTEPSTNRRRYQHLILIDRSNQAAQIPTYIHDENAVADFLADHFPSGGEELRWLSPVAVKAASAAAAILKEQQRNPSLAFIATKPLLFSPSMTKQSNEKASSKSNGIRKVGNTESVEF